MAIKNVKQLLLARAKMFFLIRQYFEKHAAIEVDTRLLDQFSVTDPYMTAFQVINQNNKNAGFLQTSPEFAMKRLLAAGSGDIYQLGKAFRADEKGQYHDCEFTLLEWYRLGFSMSDLMDEVFHLITQLIGKKSQQTFSYREAFKKHLNIDPFTISHTELEKISQKKLGLLPDNMLRDNYLTLLFSELVEPNFDPTKITIVTHYPASQASLAQTIEQDGFQVAERFEVYCGGVELANGFHELTDAKEQKVRFEMDNQTRHALNYPEIMIDERLIEALESGLPDCSGVALGIDRLLMLQLGEQQISKVLPLP